MFTWVLGVCRQSVGGAVVGRACLLGVVGAVKCQNTALNQR